MHGTLPASPLWESLSHQSCLSLVPKSGHFGASSHLCCFLPACLPLHQPCAQQVTRVSVPLLFPQELQQLVQHIRQEARARQRAREHEAERLRIEIVTLREALEEQTAARASLEGQLRVQREETGEGSGGWHQGQVRTKEVMWDKP